MAEILACIIGYVAVGALVARYGTHLLFRDELRAPHGDPDFATGVAMFLWVFWPVWVIAAMVWFACRLVIR